MALAHRTLDLVNIPSESRDEAAVYDYVTAGVPLDQPIVTSCGSGVTACHNLLAMEQAGLGRGRLFPGSWSQWSRDPARPVQNGDG